MAIRDLESVDSSLFKGLSVQELEQLENAATPLVLGKDEVLFEEGDEGDFLCVVKKGLLGVYLQGPDGKLQQVSARGDGAVIGEYAVLTGEARSATIKALMPTELLAIPGESFMSVARGSHTLLMNINTMLAQRLHDVNRVIIRHKGQVIVLVGDLPIQLSQWLAQNFSVAVREVSAKDTIFLGAAPPPENIVRLPNRLSMETFLDGVKGFPEAGLDALPVEKVLSIEPSRNLFEAKEVSDLKPFFMALENGAYFADFIILNLASAPPGSLAPLLSEVTPELFRRISQVIWIADGVNDLPKQVRYVRETVDSVGLDYERVSWLILDEGQKLTQGVRKESEKVLGGKVLSVLPISLKKGVPNGISPWAEGKVWYALMEAARVICRKQVGVAFGGGGTKGFAHIGIIKGFEELGLSADYVAGTSAGSIIGALWALGRTSEELVQDAQRLKSWGSTLKLVVPKLPVPIKSLLSGRGLRSLIRDQVGDLAFEDTFIPFAAVAARMYSNRPVIFNTGPLLTGLVASCSIPMLFPPVKLHGKVLVDGGQVEPVPVPTLKLMGADQVIAIRLGMTEEEVKEAESHSMLAYPGDEAEAEDPLPGWLSMYFNVFDSLRYEIASNAVRTADVRLQPSFKFGNWNQIKRMDEFIDAGYRTVYESKAELKRALPWLGRKGAAI